MNLFIVFLALITITGSAVAKNNAVSSIDKYEIELSNHLVKSSGGFHPGIGSSIDFSQKLENGDLEFFAISDRGANYPRYENDSQIISFYPEFSPKIVRVIVSKKSNEASVKDFVEISYQGKPITGINPNQNISDEEIYDRNFKRINSNFGLDTESIAMLSSGDFVVGDEYYPSLNIVNNKGQIIRRLIPGNGLPEVLKHRNFNKGFEAVTVAPNGKIYAMLEGVLNIDIESNENTKLIRIIEVDLNSSVVKMYAYPFDYDKYKKSNKAKIGDIVALDNQNFLLIEQGVGIDNNYRNIIYKVNLDNATDISGLNLDNGKELEFGDLDSLKDINFIKKELFLNPRDYGWQDNKLEGIAIIDSNTIALTNDNDFAITGYKISEAQCMGDSSKICKTAVPEIDLAAEKTKLWIISFDSKI